jgi:hypothetical protein
MPPHVLDTRPDFFHRVENGDVRYTSSLAHQRISSSLATSILFKSRGAVKL